MANKGKTAKELALEQREISIAEFFEKNRHLLGFDNPAKALLTVVKEATDNSLTYDTPFLAKDGNGTEVRKIGDFIDEKIEISEKAEVMRNGDLQKLELNDNRIKTLCFDPETLELGFKPVKTVFRHKINSKIFKVTLEGGRHVSLTNYHSIFTCKDGKIKSIKTEKLKPGDYIVVPNGTWQGKVNQKINLLDELFKLPPEKTERVGVYGIRDKLLDLEEELKEILPAEKRYRINDFRKCDRIPLNLLRKLDIDKEKFKDCKLDVMFGKSKIPAEIPINKDLAEFLGFYTAEGSTTEDLKVYLSFGKHEEEIIEYVKKLSKRLWNISPSAIDAHSSAKNVTLYSSILVLILKEIFKTGKYAKKKRIPRFVFEFPSELKERYLTAYLSGDGYPCSKIFQFHKNGKKISEIPMERLILGTSSKELTVGIQYLLSSIGIDSTYEKKEGEIREIKGKKAEFSPSHVLYLYTKQKESSIKKLPISEVIEEVKGNGWYKERFKTQTCYTTDYAFRLQEKGKLTFKDGGEKFAKSNLGLLKVKRIEKVKPKGKWVYDISVPGYENFMAGSAPIACHNSLDAGEDARILPEIKVKVEEEGKRKYKVDVEDNGPGIVKEQIPRIFGKLLYGSKFHRLLQSLHPQEPILIEKNNKIELREIGEFCDSYISGREEGKMKIENKNIKVPCFDRENYQIKWRPVTHVFRHENKNKTYLIKTERGREIRVTGNHSLFTFDPESLSIREVKASELGKGGLILAPEKIPEPPEKIKEINLLDYMESSEVKGHRWYVYGIDKKVLERIKTGEKIRKKPSPNSNRERTYYRYKGVDIRKDSLESNYLPKRFLPVDKVLELGLVEEVKDCVIRTYQVGGKISEIPVTIELTPEIMRFFGLYVAEGHSDKRQFGFTLGSKEKEFQQELAATAGEQLNVNTTLVNRERNSKRLKVFGGPLSLIMRKLCGVRAKEKEVPEFVFRTSKKLRQHFLDGLYNGDGSDAHPSNQLNLGTTSKKLALQVSYLWNLQGVISSWEEKQSGGYGSSGKNYYILTYGEDVKKSLFYNAETDRKTSYRMIPMELLQNFSFENSGSKFVHPSMEGIFSAIGLGSQRKFGQKFYDKMRKIRENKKVEEDYFTKKLEKLNLIIKEGENYKITPIFEKMLKKFKEILKFVRSDLSLLRVKEVREIKSPKFVYDLSVPGSGSDENFLAGSKGAICVKNSRGQQGMGISAAVLYSQLTRGKPVIIHSKPHKNSKTKVFHLKINTVKNEPEIIKEDVIEDGMKHTGTKITLHVEGKYLNRYHSVDEYLQQTAIVNPYAEIEYESPEGENLEFPRVVEKLPKSPKEIKPHPNGVELGVLIRMLKNTKSRSISSFLKNDFCRIGSTTAEEIYRLAEIDKSRKPKSLSHREQRRLLEAMRKVKVMRPPTDCLSPIGEDLIKKGLTKELNPEFVASVTRDPTVYRGNPFRVECGISYGGDLMEEKESPVKVMRFANKVPLLYQASSCAITKAIRETGWRRYGLDQPGGSGIPKGPAVILVHLCSTWVPFTSESKESIARYPEIVKEIKLAIQESARKLKRYVRREEKAEKESRRYKIFQNYVPLIVENAKVLAESKEKLEVNSILKKLVDKELIEEKGEENDE